MRAICIGGATVDTIATIDSDRIERMSMLNAETSFLLLEEGRKTEALDISTHSGGGAINASVALARLGCDVSALVKLGRDERSEVVLARLAEENVSTQWVVRDAEAPTGASVIISSHERNAAVFTFRGANELLTAEDVPAEALETDLAYISGLPSACAELLPQLIEKAKDGGALVAVNAGVRQLAANADGLLDSLAKVDLLALNRREAEALMPSLARRRDNARPRPAAEIGDDAPALLKRGLVSGDFKMSLPHFFAILHALGTHRVLITDGAGGAFVGADGEVLHSPAAAADIVASTAGAGDATVATFAAFVTEGQPADVALRAAALNAASVIAYIDTQTGLQHRGVLQERVDAMDGYQLRKWKL
jgi:ribokinase